MTHVYPAILHEEHNNGYSVSFPTVEGVITQGDTLFEALKNAEDALGEFFIKLEDPCKVNNKFDGSNPFIDKDERDGFITLIAVDEDEQLKKKNRLHEVWFNPKNKKLFTVLKDDNVKVKPFAEKLLREISGT